MNEALQLLRAGLKESVSTSELYPTDVWEFQPVGIREFIDSPDYLDLKNECFEQHKRDLEELFGTGNPLERKYTEAVFLESIGAGKSYISSIISTYIAYILLCMRNPAKTLGLTPGSRIAIMNLSVSATHAARVVYSEIRSKVMRCRWFMRHYPPVEHIKTEVRFDEKDHAKVNGFEKQISIIPGSSTSHSAVGYNLFVGVIDEATLFKDNVGHDSIESVYTALHRRITSRFGKKGLLVMVGSPKYTEDYLEKKIKSPASDIFHVRRASWETKFTDWETNKPEQDITRLDEWLCKWPEWDGGMFYFDPSSWKIEANWSPNVWSIPSLYLKDFVSRPTEAMRDLGATPSEAINTFFPRAEVILQSASIEDLSTCPILAGNVLAPGHLGPVGVPVAVHLDLSKMNGGDACGLAAGCFGGWHENGGVIIQILLAARFQGTSRAPVHIEVVRQFIYSMTAAGYKIALISADNFQSLDALQTLERKGYKTEVLSVDKTSVPYFDLRAAMEDKRLIWTIHTASRDKDGLLSPCHHSDTRKWTASEWAYNELRHLEYNAETGKVDHPSHFSKDVADAIAAVTHHVVHSTGLHSRPNLIRAGTISGMVKKEEKAASTIEEAVARYERAGFRVNR